MRLMFSFFFGFFTIPQFLVMYWRPILHFHGKITEHIHGYYYLAELFGIQTSHFLSTRLRTYPMTHYIMSFYLAHQMAQIRVEVIFQTDISIIFDEQWTKIKLLEMSHVSGQNGIGLLSAWWFRWHELVIVATDILCHHRVDVCCQICSIPIPKPSQCLFVFVLNLARRS